MLAERSAPQAGRSITMQWLEVFRPLLAPATYKGAYGGRGSAKSWFFAQLLILYFIRRPSLRAVCIREVQKSLDQSAKRLIEDVIHRYQLGYMFRIMDRHIETSAGGIIIFNGMQNHTADTIKSLEGYGVAWCEEAQSLSARSIELLRPTLRADDAELWFSWNPDDPKDPIDTLLRGPVLPPNAVVVKSTYKDNRFFPDKLRRDMEFDRARDFETYLHVWEGMYRTQSAAAVFKNWRVDTPDANGNYQSEAPPNTIFYFGGDWGYAIDPAVCIRAWLSGRTLYIDHEAYDTGVEIDDLPAHFARVPLSSQWPLTADSARPDTISYMARHGYPHIRASIKGQDSVAEGVIFLQSYDIVVHPRCVHTIDELKNYSYRVDPITNEVTSILADKKNHVIDSLRYAMERVMRSVGGRQVKAAW